MEFPEFISLLYSVIGAANSTHAFTKSILEAIVTDEGQEVLDGYSEDSYKAYYNGHTKITRLAQKISVYIEPEEFPGYFKQFSDATVQSLCDIFQPYLPDINLHNVGEELAALFAEIIKEAASAKKKGTPRGAGKAETIEAEVVDDSEPSGTGEDKKDKKTTVIQHQTNVCF